MENADPSLTVPQFWRAALAEHVNRVLIRKDGASWTMADIDQRSAALACGLLVRGAGKANRIGLLLPNGPEWVSAWLAISRIGAIPVCLSTFSTARELAFAVRNADVSILLSADRFLRNDYVERLEGAFPGLREADGSSPLALEGAPHLREVWIAGETRPSWARGSLDDLASAAGSLAFHGEFLSRVEAAVRPADPGLLMYTSGSTADPKGIVHTQATVVGKTRFLGRGVGVIPFKLETGDRQIVTAPFFWVGGFLSLTGAILRGATVICADSSSPDLLLILVREERATHVSGPETTLAALRDHPDRRPDDLEALRPQNVNQLPFFDPQIPRDRVAYTLGMTETLGPHSGDVSSPILSAEDAGAFGSALGAMEYRIIDPDTGAILPHGTAGELCVRGPWLMEGIYGRQRHDVFDQDGFYRTGDWCTLRKTGRLVFHRRYSDMIKSSGANVAPEEVEQAIGELEDVAEAVVVGIPDAKRGQLVAAAVALRPGRQLGVEDILTHLRGELSSFKVPKHLVIMDRAEFPRTPSNKVRKAALAEMIIAALADTNAAQPKVP